MTDIETAPIMPADIDALLELNNRHAVELSWLDRAGLQRLLGIACYARCTINRTAFLIAIDGTADYDGINFDWFRECVDGFVYVDRVAVADHARGRGLARALYRGVFEHAEAAGRSTVCCEVNADPPNLISDAFHRSLGFSAAGHGTVPSGKTVQYMTRTTSSRMPAFV